MSVRRFLQLPLAIAFLSLLPARVSRAVEPAPRFALLVGVGVYPQLSEAEQLEGSNNDVALMKETLITRFGFDPDQIVTLTDQAATGDAIRAALDDLANKVSRLPDDSPQAQVVFHFSGHGAQLPDQVDGNRDEPDGLDETLVPCDATKQGGDADIRDDELNEFAHRICGNQKAHLWMVLDCCHSGTGTRGIHKSGTPGLTRYRKLDRKLNATSTGSPLNIKRLPIGVVALYACRDKELEPEYSDGEQKYGLLTRFLTQVINEQERLADCTYGFLRDVIAARYRQDRSISYNAPVPQLEASAPLFESAVLGSIGKPRPNYWEVRADGPATALLAGAFHGMTKGSIFEVYVTPEDVVWGQADEIASPQGKSLGWIQVERVDGSTCKANFISWKDGEPVKQTLPREFKTGFALERFHSRDDFDVRLKVVTVGNDSVGLDFASPRMPSVIRDAVQTARQQNESDWLALVENDQPADLVLKIDGSRAALFPGTGKPLLSGDSEGDDDPDPLRGGWGPFDLQSPDVVTELQSTFRHVTRARNLLRIASLQSSGGSKAVDVKLELLQVPDPNRFDDVKPWPTADDGSGRFPPPLEMKSGDLYSYRITNRDTSGTPVYISVLHVNSDMGIEQVFPYQDAQGIQGLAHAMLKPGESRLEGPFECNGEGEPSFGQRSTVVLATREPNHFYMLQQNTLPKIRDVGPQPSLEQLMMQNAYFRTRSRRRPVTLYDNSWGSDLIQWTVIP